VEFIVNETVRIGPGTASAVGPLIFARSHSAAQTLSRLETLTGICRRLGPFFIRGRMGKHGPFRTRDWRLTSPRLSTAQRFRSRGRTNLPLNDRDYDLESLIPPVSVYDVSYGKGRYVAIGQVGAFWF